MVFSSFLITSRETLEAALVVGIVYSYLSKTGNDQYKKTVYYGVLFGIILSVICAFLFTSFAGGFEGRAEELFEGSIMLIAATLLTTMILWMLKQKNISKDIENKVNAHIKSAIYNRNYAYGIFSLVMFAVLREGVETVLFFGAINYSSKVSIFGAVLGIITAIGIGYMFFIGSKKINIKKFFAISSIFLILISAGLVAHGVHELQEANIFPVITKHVWDTNSILDETSMIGSFLKGIFGYNGNPSLLEVISYIVYILIIFFIYLQIEKNIFTKRVFKE